MAVAFMITPWAALRMLRWHARQASHHTQEREDLTTRAYRRIMANLIGRHWLGIAFLASITLLLLGSLTLVATGAVKVKMLPFDNKGEFQIIVDMDEGSTLEHTTDEVGLDLIDSAELG